MCRYYRCVPALGFEPPKQCELTASTSVAQFLKRGCPAVRKSEWTFTTFLDEGSELGKYFCLSKTVYLCKHQALCMHSYLSILLGKLKLQAELRDRGDRKPTLKRENTLSQWVTANYVKQKAKLRLILMLSTGRRQVVLFQLFVHWGEGCCSVSPH